MENIYSKNIYPHNPIDALEYYICSAEGVSDFCKKALLWMVRKSDFLANGICLTFPFKFKLVGEETADGFHRMVSSNASIRLDLFLQGMGRRMFISHHSGHFVEHHPPGQLPTAREGMFAELSGYTVWLAPRHYDDAVKIYFVDQKLVDEIKSLALRDELAELNRRS